MTMTHTHTGVQRGKHGKAERQQALVDAATADFEQVAMADPQLAPVATFNAALGGGLLNNGGAVTLTGVSVTGNMAQAGPGLNALGGGIFSSGPSLTGRTGPANWEFPTWPR